MVLSIIGAVLGFASTRIVPRDFTSKMILDFKIDAKEQLYADVLFFNELIKKDQHEELAELLEISEEEAESLKEFGLTPYYSHIRNIRQINLFYQDLDTAVLKYVDFEELFSNDENPEISDQFVVYINSSSQTIFSKLEKPLMRFLERVPELQAERLNNLERLLYEKNVLSLEMKKLDTLKEVLNDVMKENSKANSKANSGTSINLGQSNDQSKLNPLEIYDRVIKYSKDIIDIDEKLQYFDTCYEIRKHFSAFGRKTGMSGVVRMLVGAILFFLIGVVIIVNKLIRDKERV